MLLGGTNCVIELLRFRFFKLGKGSLGNLCPSTLVAVETLPKDIQGLHNGRRYFSGRAEDWRPISHMHV
jgi:hypothetical protein